MKPKKTKVVFRYWQKDVIALFPEIPADNWGVYCQSYQHVGQHGAADYYGIMDGSRAATEAEYADLQAELLRLGYVLDLRRRTMPAVHEARKTTARAPH